MRLSRDKQHVLILLDLRQAGSLLLLGELAGLVHAVERIEGIEISLLPAGPEVGWVKNCFIGRNGRPDENLVYVKAQAERLRGFSPDPDQRRPRQREASGLHSHLPPAGRQYNLRRRILRFPRFLVRLS